MVRIARFPLVLLYSFQLKEGNICISVHSDKSDLMFSTGNVFLNKRESEQVRSFAENESMVRRSDLTNGTQFFYSILLLLNRVHSAGSTFFSPKRVGRESHMCQVVSCNLGLKGLLEFWSLCPVIPLFQDHALSHCT